MNRRVAFVALAAGLVALAGGWALQAVISRNSASPAVSGAGLDACHALIERFDAYPIVYLGDEYDGLPLRTCHRRQTPGTAYGIPPTDRVTFIYGFCELTGAEPSCAPPLQIHVLPACSPLPGEMPKLSTTRGVEALALGRASVFAAAPQFHVKISAAQGDAAKNRETALRAFDALRGANELASSISSSSRLDVETGKGTVTECGKASAQGPAADSPAISIAAQRLHLAVFVSI